MITLIVWDCHGLLNGKYEHLTLHELGKKLCELSKEWILVFDTVYDVYDQISCTMEVTKSVRRNGGPEISEHMDSDIERGVEF